MLACGVCGHVQRWASCSEMSDSTLPASLALCCYCLTSASSPFNPSIVCRAPLQMWKVVVVGAFGGRLDHEIANVGALLRWHGRFAQLSMVNDINLACLIPAGTTRLIADTRYEGPTCGLLPLAGAVDKLTTRGLKWDVTDWSTFLGGPLSTSNAIQAPATESALSSDSASIGALLSVVHISTSHPIVWMSTLRIRGDV